MRSGVTASDYEFVRYQPDNKTQVAELQTHSWSRSIELNIAYFDWKYGRNPYLAEPLIYLAMRNGRAVGMRGFFGVQWEGGNPPQRCVGLYADDLVIAPEHRNRGLIPKIMTAAFEDLANRGYDYVFNLSAGPVTFLSSLSTGWRSAGSTQPMRWRPWRASLQSVLHRLVKQSSLVSLAGDVLGRAPKVRGSLADLGQEQVKRALDAVPGISFEEAPRCGDMAELVERLGSSGRIRHVRDAQYYEWRFQNPLSRYRFLFWGKDRLGGYLVLQQCTSELANREEVNVVDWEASSAEIRAELLRAALALARTSQITVWSATLPHETTELLSKSGFGLQKRSPGTAPPGPAILIRPVRKEWLERQWLFSGLALLDLANWDLRMLYSMCG